MYRVANEQADGRAATTAARSTAQTTIDCSEPREALPAMLKLREGLAAPRRAGVVAAAVVGGKRWGHDLAQAYCEVGARIAHRLGLGDGVEQALLAFLERWDAQRRARSFRL